MWTFHYLFIAFWHKQYSINIKFRSGEIIAQCLLACPVPCNMSWRLVLVVFDVRAIYFLIHPSSLVILHCWRHFFLHMEISIRHLNRSVAFTAALQYYLWAYLPNTSVNGDIIWWACFLMELNSNFYCGGGIGVNYIFAHLLHFSRGLLFMFDVELQDIFKNFFHGHLFMIRCVLTHFLLTYFWVVNKLFMSAIVN